MKRATPILTTFMGKRWEVCPKCRRDVAVRSDGKFERHNKVKGVQDTCTNSLQPSGRKNVRKQDKRDRVALMKSSIKSTRKQLRYRWVCRWTNNASSWKDLDVCGARGRVVYATREEAIKAGEKHRKNCPGPSYHSWVEVEDVLERRR